MTARRSFGWVAAVALCWGACSSDEPAEPPTHVGTSSVQALVGRDGARLELESGVVVTIPRDALDSELMLEVSAADARKLAPSGPNATLEEPVGLKPHGTRFSKSIEIEVPIRSKRGSGDERALASMRLADNRDEEWENIETAEIDETNKRAIMRTKTFSYYAVAWVTQAEDGAAEAGVEDAAASAVDVVPDASSGVAPSQSGAAAGESCDVDADCASDLVCLVIDDTGGLCLMPCATDADCTDSLCHAEALVCITLEGCESMCQDPCACDERFLCSCPTN